MIVVLAAGVTQKDNGPRKFEKDEVTFDYEIQGDPYEFRFKAVKKILLNGSCSKFVLVGGNVEMIKGDEKKSFFDKNGQVVSKSEVMKHCLVNHYQIPEENIVCLHSVSNTIGNAKEVSKHFSENKTKDLGTVGLLTSFYHLSRSMRMFVEEANLRLIPISAESVVYHEEFENVRKFYHEEGFSRILHDAKDHRSEIKGMGDQEQNNYQPGFK